MSSTIGKRIFAGFGAALFLLTSSALAILVIVTLIQSSKTDSSSSSNSTSNSKQVNVKAAANKQGTKLSGFTPVASVPSLQISDTKVGTGATAESGDTVKVNYTGAVASTGIIFQSSSSPVSLSLSQVIKGWQQGIPGMKVGGVRRLVIPANLAYGANPPSGSGIPANAPLVFDITLYSVSK